jgi:hypothetical protein
MHPDTFYVGVCYVAPSVFGGYEIDIQSGYDHTRKQRKWGGLPRHNKGTLLEAVAIAQRLDEDYRRDHYGGGNDRRILPGLPECVRRLDGQHAESD